MKKYIIIDIDGTVANKSAHRGIYDYDLVYLDEPILPAVSVIKTLSLHYIPIYMSGRSDSCREVTSRWLQENGLGKHSPISLYMRSEGDSRRDDDVKRELLYRFLSDYRITKEDILGVFDDRPKVIRMWISEGIFVFDVNNGRGEF